MRRCRYCGETAEDQFDSCWKCGKAYETSARKGDLLSLDDPYRILGKDDVQDDEDASREPQTPSSVPDPKEEDVRQLVNSLKMEVQQLKQEQAQKEQSESGCGVIGCLINVGITLAVLYWLFFGGGFRDLFGLLLFFGLRK